MQKKEIRKELKRLYEAESSLLFKFATDKDCSPQQLSYISRKIFEISDLIYKLERIYEELSDD